MHANDEGVPLPQLAQVAQQQGIYLSKVLNGSQRDDEKEEFNFFSLGSMAYVGDLKGIYDGSTVGEPGKEIKTPRITGLLALLLWRFAWGQHTSPINKMLIPMHWFKSFLFGRGEFLICSLDRVVHACPSFTYTIVISQDLRYLSILIV